MAANPNVAMTDLDVLCRRFADEVASNAVLDWLTLTDTDWLNELSEVSRHRLLSSSACSPGLLWWALHGGDDDDLLALLANRALPTAIRDRAAAHEEALIVEAAMLHTSIGVPPCSLDLENDRETVAGGFARITDEPELGELLVADLVPATLLAVVGLPDDGDARRELARRADTPAATLRLLLGDDDATTRRYAHRNPSTGPSDRARWDRLAEGGRDLGAVDLAVLATGSFGRERCASHPALPADVLASCVVDQSWRVREAAAANPSLTVAQVAVLANDPDRDVRAAAARNRVLPDDAAIALTLDTDSRVVIAAEQRLRLAPDRPTVSDPELLVRSASDDALDRLRRRSAVMTADLRRCSSATFAALVGGDDTVLRVALASNPTTPNGVLAELAIDHDALVRRCAAGTTTNPELLATLASDPNTDVQVAVAANRVLPEFVALRLADTENDDIRTALLLRADRTPTLMAKLFESDADQSVVEIICAPTIRSVASGPPDDTVLDRLRSVLDRHPWVALVLARQPTTSALVLTVLRSSANWRVRQGVAMHANTPVDVLILLAGDADNDVRSAVAAHASVRPEEVATFFTETDEKVRRSLVGRLDLGAELLAVHVLGDDGIRDGALTHPSLAPPMRDELQALRSGRPVAAQTLDTFLTTSARPLVVAHPGATVEQLRVAASDPAWMIREAVAEHRNCHADDLVALSLDQDRDVRAAVAANPNTPPSTVVLLVDDGDPRVRRAAATNPSVGAGREGVVALSRRRGLAQALRSSRSVVRAVALLDPSVSASEVRRPRHAQSIDWVERLAVAQHPNCPTDLRERLAGDANRLVAAVAGGEMQWP